MRGEAGDCLGADDAAHVVRVEVGLPNVHAGGGSQDCQISAIVDDHHRAGRPGRIHDSDCQIQERSTGQRFRAQLQQPNTGIQIGMRQIQRRPCGPLADLGIDNGVETRKSQALSASWDALGRG